MEQTVEINILHSDTKCPDSAFAVESPIQQTTKKSSQTIPNVTSKTDPSAGSSKNLSREDWNKTNELLPIKEPTTKGKSSFRPPQTPSTKDHAPEQTNKEINGQETPHNIKLPSKSDNSIKSFPEVKNSSQTLPQNNGKEAPSPEKTKKLGLIPEATSPSLSNEAQQNQIDNMMKIIEENNRLINALIGSVMILGIIVGLLVCYNFCQNRRNGRYGQIEDYYLETDLKDGLEVSKKSTKRREFLKRGKRNDSKRSIQFELTDPKNK